MNPSSIEAMTRDKDLAAQPLPQRGHPSQDPNPAAQVPLTPAEAERESHSTLVGGGAVAGAAAGAAVGAVVGGPVGGLVGGTVGLMAGGLGGAATGSLVKPEDPASTIPEPSEPEATRIGETRQEDLRR